MAFRAAIERVNMDKRILPHVKLVPVVQVLDTIDGFAVSRKGARPPLVLQPLLFSSPEKKKDD